MPSIYFNPLVLNSFGRVVLRRRGDKVFFARPPRERKGPGVARNVQMFREATTCAKLVFAHPVRRAPFDVLAKARGQQTYHVILADFLKRPLLRNVDVTTF